MSITDELREWTREQRTGNVLTCYPPKHEIHGVEEDVLAIADRIDAELADTQAFCDCLQESAQGREDVTLWDVDYTALPVDRNGASVHVDDVMTNGEYVFVVNRICRYTDGWLICDLNGVALAASDIWHYEAPTVEGVLREFADVVRKEYIELAFISDETLAEFAAKLMLKEDK